jgi:methylenetetrahydrofolate reductase (NADPH)
MKIIDKLASSRPAFSFEFFPPKDEDGRVRLFETVSKLRRYEPAYVSVTWGAGGGTRRLTIELVEQIASQTGLDAMAHLTCVGATRAELTGILEQLRQAGVENVLALRGDPPKGDTEFRAVENGCAHASELVEFIRAEHGQSLCVAGACYPEVHPDAPNAATDLAHLKRKVDAGADFLITQLFFDNRDYFGFVERARAAGITVPVIAGIMPVTNFSQIKRFSAGCGAKLPESLLTALEEAGEDAARVREVGVAYATEQCRELLERGVPGIHFYTLNRSPATVQILEALRA